MISPNSPQDPPDQSAERLPRDAAARKQLIDEMLTACRSYLMVVANAELARDVAAKVAPSDIVQETLLEAHVDVDRFRGETRDELLAWLRQILRHNLLNVSRRYRDTASRKIARETKLNNGSSSDGAMPKLVDPWPGPGSEVIQSEDEQQLLAALSRLPEKYRIVIELRNRDRLSFTEIGAQTDCSPEAARKTWARAISMLRSELRELQ